MNKITSALPIVIAGLALVASCRIAEVSSAPRTVRIALAAGEPSRYTVHVINSSGIFELAARTGDGHYTLMIPRMDGGYTEWGGIRYNRHMPEEYPVIQIRWDTHLRKELSLRDLERLAKKNGVYQLKMD